MEPRQSILLAPHFQEIKTVQKNWGWFLALGILLVILGCLAISTSVYTTILSVVILGAFLIVAGLVQVFQAFMARAWSGFFLSLLLGVLYVVTGILCLAKPAVMAVGLTLWIAAFFFIAGIFRMCTSAYLRFRHWGWIFFNGLVTFILGVLIISEWPISGLWVIGLFIGIDLIFAGWAWVLLSLTARQPAKTKQ